MTIYLETEGAFRPWGGERLPSGLLIHPSMVALWSDEERAAEGLYVPLIPDVPQGQFVVASRVVRRGDAVAYEYDLAEIIVPDATGDQVNAERDRRIDGGFIFLGHRLDSGPEDRENIAGAKSAATDAITMFEAKPGDLRWQRLMDSSAPDDDFVWIVADNARVPLDAFQTMQLGYAAMTHKQRHIFAANDLKKMQPIPADYADDKWWPTVT